MQWTLYVFLSFCLLASHAFADQVELKPDVVGPVNVRSDPSVDNPPIGELNNGESLEYVESIPFWHEIRLPNGEPGFIAKRLTQVVEDSPTETAEWAVHFVDVGTGDGAIIDMGDREIVIDGGNFVNTMLNYNDEHDLIQGPIELVIVTHADADHWKGLSRLLGYDGVVDDPPEVLEFWEPGHDRGCRPLDSYDEFIAEAQRRVPAADFKRPLEDHHPPSTASGEIEPFTLESLPGVTFTLLHSEAEPADAECSYKINNASIVVKIELDGVSFLFTGDANGKERDEVSPGTPGHIEARLLSLAGNALEADVLKAPHHGSETASTQAFVDAVNPDFVVISASTIHHLPRDTVVERYRHEAPNRVVLRTDRNRSSGVDHLVCMRFQGELTCNHESVFVQ